MLNLSNTLIQAGEMVRASPDLPWYFGRITIPNEAFRVQFTATADSGATALYSPTKRYIPKSYSVRIEPDRALFQRGETVGGRVSVYSATASGSYSVVLVPPPGFSAPVRTWTVSLTPGATVRIPFSITAPLEAASYGTFLLTVRAAAAASAEAPGEANLRLIVE